ncbi:amidohydrolase [Zhouia amylolytica]|uniref:Lipoprotein n=1 Tax=Zhouia amylolytica AD3 TaxID=1286632 RepID=W2ULH7_9FLAO|nr:amidohydrolase [Zhouia amylolytica]ETN94182.1 lipoprotein [Zhouia amylolytica AD3]
MKFIYIVLAFCIVSCTDTKKETAHLDSIYFNGDIITMEGDQPGYVEAIGIKDGRIARVGTQEELMSMVGDSTIQKDLNGKTLLPAFLDGHGHFYSVGFASIVANILPPPDGPGHNYESIVDALNQWKESEDGKYFIDKFGWIIGNGYDDSQLEEKDHPKSIDLDKVSTDIPIIILHQSGHLGVINSKAKEILGITKDTPNPNGGSLRRDANGNPNGVLEENAMYNVLVPILGKADEDFDSKCIKKGQEEYAKKGYLTAQDGRSSTAQMAAFIKGAENGLFYIDVVSYPDITLGPENVTEDYYSTDHQYKNNYRIGGVKLTLDGSPQGKTAWLTQHYHVPPQGQDKDYKGYPVMPDSMAIKYVKEAFQNKWQLLCHTNGDAAIDQYIMAVKAAEEAYGYDDHRTVMIHGQTLRKDQIPQLVDLEIMPSLFPMHTFYWGDWHVESVLGHPRADYISPCRDVIDAGLKITSHHDAPVTFPNSLRVLDATVNRVTRSGAVLGPEQRISPYEGLKTLTEWAAYQYFEEDRKGTITEGKLADLVILDKNPLKIDPLNIKDIEIIESIKEGKTVYRHP